MKLPIVLSAAAVLAVACVNAEGAAIGSYATGAPNLGNTNSAMNFGGSSTVNTPLGGVAPTFTLNPNGVWENPPAGSTWIGYLPTAGPLSGINPPGSITSPVYYTFDTTFLAALPYTGSISVDADDTTDVFLNGVLITPDGILGGDGLCANGLPNCTVSDPLHISGNAGLNVLTFVVEQAGTDSTSDDPSGLAFAGSIAETPEPSSLVLFGTSLLSACIFLRRGLLAR